LLPVTLQGQKQFRITTQVSSVLGQHRHRLTATTHAYDSYFCFDIWHTTNADYLITNLWYYCYVCICRWCDI